MAKQPSKPEPTIKPAEKPKEKPVREVPEEPWHKKSFVPKETK
jgi:hypothetical protein